MEFRARSHRRPHRSPSRRTYLRELVALGGVAGLAACLEAPGAQAVPTGDPARRPTRQHAWNETLATDEAGNRVPPEHHVLVPLRLRGDVDEANRSRMAAALRSLERAYAHGPDGLLFTVGYTPAYFDRVPASPLPEPEPLTTMETPDLDAFDAVVHLASDHPSVVIEAEEALFGGVDEPNGVPMDETLSGLFERVSPRRTGFVGPGLPVEYADHEAVPESVPPAAPFFMGFRSGFAESQAPEDRVTIRSGPFAGGTTMHIESLDIQLQTWYEQETHHQRVAKTFSPAHADEDRVESVGASLGASTGVGGEIADRTATDARSRGVVGHAQKAARARDDDGTPPLLRRDVNTMDGDRPGLHFVSLQRSIDEFVRVRDAMTGAALAGDGVGQRLNNGLLQYLFVRRRGNFLLPPRGNRALPDGS